jgi:hypothetical protein
LVNDVLRVASCAGSVRVASLAKRVSRNTDSSLKFISGIASSA